MLLPTSAAHPRTAQPTADLLTLVKRETTIAARGADRTTVVRPWIG